MASMPAPAGEGVEAWYVQRFPAPGGTGALLTRWSIHTPDGRLIESDSAGGGRTARRNLDDWFMKAQMDVSHGAMRALIPASAIDPRASRFEVLVLDLTMERVP